MITQRQSLGLLVGALLLSLCGWPAGTAAAATLELTGPAGAVVSLNDRPLGQFPLDGPLDLPPGNYEIRCNLKGYAPYQHKVRLTSIKDWQRVAVRLLPFSRRTAWSSNLLFAGLGQHYLDHSFRGYVYNAAEAGGLLAALAGELQRSNLKNDYLKLVDQYNSTLNAEDIVRLGAEAEAKYSDMKDMEELRDTGLMIAGGAIVLSIIDALLIFPSVEGGTGPVPMDTGSLDTPWRDSETNNALHASLRLTF